MIKRLVILLVFLLGLISFVVAQGHPLCDPEDNPDIQGVFINGECFNCGDHNDGVCPQDYGADCSRIPGSDTDPDCGPVIPEAFWSLDNLTLEEEIEVNLLDEPYIYLVVRNIPLEFEGIDLTFDVYEDVNVFLSDSIDNVATATVTNNRAVGIWKITGEDLEEVNEDEYKLYFEASGDGWSMSSKENDPESLLNITTSVGGPEITECADYSQNNCSADPEGVGIWTGIYEPYDSGLCQRRQNGTGCEWIGNSCAQKTAYQYSPDNPDTCEEIDISCTYDETISTETESCAVQDVFEITYKSSADPDNCPDITRSPLPCPERIRLPFFGFYNIFVSLGIISIIYLFLLKKKLI